MRINRRTLAACGVHATGLPKRTDFDLFVIQVPNAPFGVGWYQGDLRTNWEARRTGAQHRCLP
jgi:hypothetical protein